MLVLGSIHAAASGIGHLPEVSFITDVGACGGRLLAFSLSRQALVPGLQRIDMSKR